MITEQEIIKQCKQIHLRKSKEYFKTNEFKKWTDECIDLAKENNKLVKNDA